ncbi:MAG: UvrD-helicase domain-containing protein [Pseudomonadales bacterium]
MYNNITFISAGAGSGKTYSLTETLGKMLAANKVEPHGVMATTFTRLAAGELKERVRSRLIESGELVLANQMEQAVIGTVNSVCGELLQRFAFEAGLPPDLKVIDDTDNALLLNSAMESVLSDEPGLIEAMNRAARRLDVVDRNDRQQRLQWRKHVRDIIVQARANNQAAQAVAAQGVASADSLLQHFRKPAQRKLDECLLEAVMQALHAIEASREEVGDATKTTSDYLDRLREVCNALRNGRMKWATWFALVDAAPGAKSRAHAEQVQQVAADIDVHPGLQQDIRWFTEQLFVIAARTMDAYEALKMCKGLIDFVDQEQRVYALLDNPIVSTALREEFQLLLVDEFQDTSPIQLALFLKLSRCIKHVIWVGDIKQSIYGFRGSDPALMHAVVARVLSEGSPPQILEDSWRSTPALVAYANALFAPAFDNTLPREQVVLHAKREQDAPTGIKQASIEQWTLEGGKKEERAAALAAGVAALLASGRQVYDKQRKAWRPVRAGDIAILCRTNNNLAEAATALAASGTPLHYKRSGLLQTAEGCLAMACLRRLLDPRDTLASAEIHSLHSCESPEAWIPERLAYLAEAGQFSAQWLEGVAGHPVANLRAMRARLPLLTPVEALRAALEAADVRKTVYRWGPDQAAAQHRLDNLAVLVAHAEAYESRAATFSEPVSTLGLVLWLQQLAEEELDTQADGGGDNAVQLVTHHGAKGLEWPVVIAADLDSELKPRIWGLGVLAREGAVDLDDTLGGRRLEYWCDFSNAKKPNTPLLERLAGSERAMRAKVAETEEMKRLLYVTVTRARDALVIPLPKKPGAERWMHCVDTGVLLPAGDTLALPCGTVAQCCSSVYSAASDIEYEPAIFSPQWIRVAEPAGDLLPLRLSPSGVAALSTQQTGAANDGGSCAHAAIGEIITLGEPLQVQGDYEPAKLGSALHAVIATTLAGGPDAQYILQQHGMLEHLQPAMAQACGVRFAGVVQDRFQPVSIAVEHPIRYVNAQGQQVQGWIDCLLDTKAGWVLIDHKSGSVGASGWASVALQYAGQLACYADGLAKATGKQVVSSWVHFALGGGLVEVRI